MVKQVTATVRSFDSYQASAHPGSFYPAEAHGVAAGNAHEGGAPIYDFPDFHRPDATDILYGLHSERNFSSTDWFGESGKSSFKVTSYHHEDASPPSYISSGWTHEAAPPQEVERQEGVDQPWLGSAKEESFYVSDWEYEDSDWPYITSEWKPESGAHTGVAATHEYQAFFSGVFSRGSVDGGGLLETYPEYNGHDDWS